MSKPILHRPDCPGTRLLRGVGVTHEFEPKGHERPGEYGANPQWNRKKLGKGKGKRKRSREDFDII